MGLQSLIFSTVNRLANPMYVVDPDGFNPRNQGSYKGLRSIPIMKQARYFTPEEAIALTQLEADLAVKKESAITALNAMTKIEGHDRDVTIAHNHYRIASAKSTLAKVESATAAAAYLKSQRVDYKNLAESLQGRAFEVKARLSAAR